MRARERARPAARVGGLAVLLAAALVLLPGEAPRADEVDAACPGDMVRVTAALCVDPFEAFLEEVDDAGAVVRVHPPNELVGKKRVRAANRRGATPQAYISQEEASAACVEAGKRLCTDKEWLATCQGRPATRYPYGTRRRAGYCNDDGTEALPAVFPGRMNEWHRLMNDPRLDKVPGTVAPSGSFTRCRSELEVFDLVGNLHEWTADPAGTMRGGFFLDTTQLGEGCEYDANAHDALYHDYSTGFRCCRDAAVAKP